MPNSEMMKFRHRNGGMLSCGWLPPAGRAPAGLMVGRARRGVGLSVAQAAQTLPAGDGWSAVGGGRLAGWVCAGICCWVSVTVSAPPTWPSV